MFGVTIFSNFTEFKAYLLLIVSDLFRNSSSTLENFL